MASPEAMSPYGSFILPTGQVEGDKMTHDEYVAKVFSIHGNNVSIISTYTGSEKPIKARCNICGSSLILNRAAELSRQCNHVPCRMCNSHKQANVARSSATKRLENMRKKCIGQRIWQNQAGMYATCTEYLGTNDITVLFENGTVAVHKQWAKFVAGSVYWDCKNEYIGKRFMQSNGMSIECIRYNVADDCDFMFENGEIVYNRCIGDAIKGTIALPSKKFVPVVIDNHQINSMADFCRTFNMATTTVHKLYDLGFSLEDIKAIKIRPSRYKTVIDGVEYSSRKAACEQLGIAQSVLCNRIRRGLSVEDAAKIPKWYSFGEKTVKDILLSKGLVENVDFYHNKTLKTIFSLLGMKNEYAVFLNEYADILGISKETVGKFRFDFAITTEGKISYLIEVDGEQHFKYIRHFFKIWDRFVARCASDENKNAFASLGQIPLLRIRYNQLDLADKMIDDLFENPQKYVTRHNTYLSESEYWNIFERMQVATA